MTKAWNDATVAPQSDGFYEVLVRLNDEPEREPTIVLAEWRDGQWRLESSAGSCNGDWTSNFSWHEMSAGRAC